MNEISAVEDGAVRLAMPRVVETDHVTFNLGERHMGFAKGDELIDRVMIAVAISFRRYRGSQVFSDDNRLGDVIAIILWKIDLRQLSGTKFNQRAVRLTLRTEI